jgi:hypothetical protein
MDPDQYQNVRIRTTGFFSYTNPPHCPYRNSKAVTKCYVYYVAVLAAGAPELAPFMADECLLAMPDMEGIDYTMKEYMKLVEKTRECVERLNSQGDQFATFLINRSKRSKKRSQSGPWFGTVPQSRQSARFSLQSSELARVGKNPVFFFKKPSPVGFLGFFWVFLGFFGIFCPDGRVFRVFFSFTNSFRCIQTLNYNHSY